MASTNIEVLPSECAGHEQHSDVDSKKKSNPISDQHDPGTIANGIKNSMRVPPTSNVSFRSFQSCFTSALVRPQLLSCISHSKGRIILLGVFTSIVMVIGILIVYYTSPKSPGMFFLVYLYIR
jgi:hypothetical protein